MMEPGDAPQLLVLGGVLMLLLLWMLRRSFLLLPAREWDPQAEERAAALLHHLLSPEEQEQLTRCGYLAVPSPGVSGRVYRVPSQPGWVDVYESDKLSMRVCVEPAERLPAADVVLMHKLMIEGDERGYLHEANVVYVRPPAGPRGRRPA